MLNVCKSLNVGNDEQTIYPNAEYDPNRQEVAGSAATVRRSAGQRNKEKWNGKFRDTP